MIQNISSYEQRSRGLRETIGCGQALLCVKLLTVSSNYYLRVHPSVQNIRLSVTSSGPRDWRPFNNLSRKSLRFSLAINSSTPHIKLFRHSMRLIGEANGASNVPSRVSKTHISYLAISIVKNAKPLSRSLLRSHGSYEE